MASNSGPPIQSGQTSNPVIPSTSINTSTSISISATISASITNGLDDAAMTTPTPSRATVSSLATSAATAIDHSTSSGRSNGEFIGAAVGCAVGGLLFGLVAAWLLLRRGRKERKSTSGHTSNATISAPPAEDTKFALAQSASTSSSNPSLDKFLLDALPDREISTEMRCLGDLIHQHVENHYHLKPALVSTSALSHTLGQVGFARESRPSPTSVADMCLAPASRQAGIQHVISQVLFKSIDFYSRSHVSMLPAPVAAFLQSLPPTDQLTESGFGKCPRIIDGSQALANASLRGMSLALSKWRMLSALLLHPNPAERAPLPISDAEIANKAADLADSLNTFLYHFVESDELLRREQTNHLQAIIVECTKLGYALFSQPRDWRFVFGNHSTTKAVVICPGLEKTSDQGRNWQQVVEPWALPIRD